MPSSEEAFAARRIGLALRGWTLERLLGVGGMAAVYAGRDAEGNVAAIKVLHPEMSLRPEVRDRFLREGYAANKVGHEGVVKVIAHDAPDEETAILVMELLEGESLGELVERAGRVTEAALLDYLDQTLDVLAAAHEAGIVHRDLKPDNLFVTTDGKVKVLDFGIARMLDGVPAEHKTRTGLALGTLPYMAPEQALGRRDEIDGRADLFSLGALSFRILSGRKVHEANSEAELLMAMASKPAPPLASVVPDASPGLCAVLDLSLAFNKHARYPDARTMQSDVRSVRAGGDATYARKVLAKTEEATVIERKAPTVTAPMPAVAEPLPSSPVSSAPAVLSAAAFAPTDPVAPMVSQRTDTAGVLSVQARPLAGSKISPARSGEKGSAVILIVTVAALGVALLGSLAVAAWYYASDDAAPATATASAPPVVAPPVPAVAEPPTSPEEPPSPTAGTRSSSKGRTSPRSRSDGGSGAGPGPTPGPSATPATRTVTPLAGPTAPVVAPAPAPAPTAAPAPEPPSPAGPNPAPPPAPAPAGPDPAPDKKPKPDKPGKGKGKGGN